MIPHNDSTYMIPYTEYVPEAAMPSTDITELIYSVQKTTILDYKPNLCLNLAITSSIKRTNSGDSNGICLDKYK